MIIWGSGGGEALLRHTDNEQLCPVCNKSSRHSIRVYYRYAHIWYLLSWLTSRNYSVMCDLCNNGVAMDKASAKAQYPKDNIPFIRKRGWMVCLALIAALMAFGAFSHSRQNEELSKVIAAPMVNDIYSADMALIEDSGYDADAASGKGKTNAFGLMKLVKVEGDNLYFAVSATAYSKKKDLRKAAGSNYSNIEFVTDNLLSLSKADFLLLNQKQVIFDAKR